MRLDNLTPTDWDNIGAYVAELRDKLGLHVWSIYIEHKPCSKRYQASIRPVYGRTHACVRLCRTWPELSREEQRHTLIHELLHLQFVPLQSAIRHIEPIVGDDVFYILNETHTEGLEYAIDAIAFTLTGLFDLPPEIVGVEEPDKTPVESVEDVAESA